MNKNLLALFFVISISFAAHAQYVSIPDSIFGAWLNVNGLSSCMTGSNSTGWHMDTTCLTVVTTGGINCTGAGISDLTGITYFPHLTTLNCSNNLLTGLPTLPAGLFDLYANGNPLTSLPPLPDSLTYLNIQDTRLTTVPVVPSTLQALYCGAHPLTSALPALPQGLLVLECLGDHLSSLPALPPKLTTLNCNTNNLSVLPVLPDSITYLDCSSNPLLTCLPHIYQRTLTHFYIAGTAIQCVPDSFIATVYDRDPDSLPICNSYCTPLGLTEATLALLHLHPNPNTGSFTLETSGAIGAGYTIYDMIGRQMASATITSDSQPVNVPLSPGIYQVTVRSLSGAASTLRYEVLK